MDWTPQTIIGFTVVLGILVVPALGLTARLALKPIVDSMLRIRDSLDRERPAPDDRRLAALEERLAGMESLLDRVARAVEFDARLRAGARPTPAAPPPPTGPRLVRPAEPQSAPGSEPRLAPDRSLFEQEYT